MDSHKSAIAALTPQMAAYAGDFADSGNINWQPYLMYFHPFDYRSDVVSTDGRGFRYTEARGTRYSATTMNKARPVRLIVGSSTVFGIGASADTHTLAARLTENDPRDELWVNFGGRSFNSTQELILFLLHRQKLPKISEIVVFSGFNDLGLARLPANLRGDHGAFFLCRDFFDALSKKKPSRFSAWFGSSAPNGDDIIPPLDAQIAYAADLTLRNLEAWQIFAAASGAKLTFVLQPLADWVRNNPTSEESRIFAELEARGSFAATYGDILSKTTHHKYAEKLRTGAEAMGASFVDFAPLLSKAAAHDEWLFVDRIHFTDNGHDLAAKLLLGALQGDIGK